GMDRYAGTRITDVAGLRLPKGMSLDDLTMQAAPGWMVQINFWLSIILALAAVALLSYGTYVLVIRRFHRAPRLIATVVTIGLGQVFVFLTSSLTSLLHRGGDGQLEILQAKPAFPFTWHVEIKPAVFGTSAI